MSTRSMIAFQDADGACYAVYCHFDGYIQHMGKMLTVHFNSEEKAIALVNEGELRSIDENKDGNVELEHFEEDFNEREIEYYDNTVQMLDAFHMSDRDYLYLWDDIAEEWLFRKAGYIENGKCSSEWKSVMEELLHGN